MVKYIRWLFKPYASLGVSHNITLWQYIKLYRKWGRVVSQIDLVVPDSYHLVIYTDRLIVKTPFIISAGLLENFKDMYVLLPAPRVL